MKRLIVSILLSVVLGATAAAACDGDKLARWATIAVDRCAAQNVTLGFDHGKRREFVTISREDGRKLYEALRARYGKKGE